MKAADVTPGQSVWVPIYTYAEATVVQVDGTHTLVRRTDGREHWVSTRVLAPKRNGKA